MSTPIQDLWNYLLDGSSSPWYSAHGDPFILDPLLKMTQDDFIIRQTPAIPAVFLRFNVTLAGPGSWFIFDLYNFTNTNKWPSLYHDGVNAKAGGARYNEGDFGAFGLVNGQVLASSACTVGVYVKGDLDGNNTQMAFKVHDGVTEYASGWVAVPGQCLGQVIVSSNQGSNDFDVSTLNGYESLTVEEVDSLYAQPLLTATLGGGQPPAPTNLSPLEGSRVPPDTASKVTLMWSDIEEAVSYHVQVSLDDLFDEQIILDASDVVETRLAIDVEVGQRLWWRVAAVNAELVESEWS